MQKSAAIYNTTIPAVFYGGTFCGGVDPRREQYAGEDVAGVEIPDYKTKYEALQNVIKDNYQLFEVDYYGVDNDNYVDGEGFCCEPKAQAKNARSLPTENVDYEKLQYYYHPDHLGSASYITNLDGEVVQHIEYVPFGEVFLEERNNTWNTPFLFNGKELDEETGLYYYGARYYNPRISLWYGVDPMAEKTMTPYAYCYNSPVRLVDPNGEDPTLYPKASLGSVDYYKWRHEDFIKQNPGKTAPDYYLSYGDKYIRRFTNETNNLLSKQGKQWLVNARENLQVAIESKLQDDPTIELRNGGDDFREFAFDSHVDAYWDAGLYKLNTVDLVAIVLTPNFQDLISEDGMRQATEMMGKLTDYWLDNPVEGAKRGTELLTNKEKIKAMVDAKVIREGLNPDKAIPILDKIIENIPTIKTDL